MTLLKTDFTYHLPEELIASHPAPERSKSRLLVWDPVDAQIDHASFYELPNWLESGDLLVFNNTSVHNARLLGRKASGGNVEVFIERLWPDGTATALIKASKAPKLGAILDIHGHQVEVVAVEKPTYRVRGVGVELTWLMDQVGHVPLPPYIQRPDTPEDQQRYQTVYAKVPGSAAAPTAGLHFDQSLLAALEARGIQTAYLTLHVGFGTFAPVRETDLSKHQMHAEWFQVPVEVTDAIAQAQAKGRRVVAVGTTSLRALESAAAAQGLDSGGRALVPHAGESRLFITPGYAFQVVDALVTNFHLPESTLLMLISAFAGHHATLNTYAQAVAERYRFFSFGDAMFITRRASVESEKR